MRFDDAKILGSSNMKAFTMFEEGAEDASIASILRTEGHAVINWGIL
jgi:hypothetical protein